MNPYDFVPIDWKRAPELRKPIWHHRLTDEDEQALFSGHIEVDLKTETPIFILQPGSNQHDDKHPATSIRNAQGDYIIPGTSLKGMLRCLVETIANGCLILFDETYEPEHVRGSSQPQYRVHYEKMVLDAFHRCNSHTKLCIACRTFGMLSQEKGGGVFLGKVNIGDAVAYPDAIYEYELGSIYTPILAEPKPRHRAFYLEKIEDQEYIAGRKYHFHHENRELLREDELRQSRSGVYMNQHILPLDYGSEFHFRIDFTSLEADEFAALLLAIALQSGMRHKIGYGKPIGLGSVQLSPTRLTIVNYARRYAQRDSARGISVWEGNDLQNLLDTNMAVLGSEIKPFIDSYLSQNAMKALQRIWHWPPEKGIEYFYPDKKDWFDRLENKGKRIADTKKVP
jgi:CRISPR/Cas system CSM-associated protein Csm3 (group 7 of RAMP superfamily)